MRIPFSDSDLAQRETLVLRHYGEGNNKEVNYIITAVYLGLERFMTVSDHPFEVKTSAKGGRELLLHQPRMRKIIESRGKSFAYEVTYLVELQDAVGKVRREEVLVDYAPEALVADVRKSNYAANSRPLDVSLGAATAWLEIGTLRADASATAKSFTFQVYFINEEGAVVYTQPEDFPLQLQDAPASNSSQLTDGSLHVTFPARRGGGALKVAAKFVEEERIVTIGVLFEGGTGGRSLLEVKLKTLSETPLVTLDDFVPAKGVAVMGRQLLLADGSGILLLGHLPVRVTDERGAGYTVEGHLTNGAGQAQNPLTIAHDLPGLTNEQTVMNAFGTRPARHTFQLADAPDNLRSGTQKRNRVYEHRLPVEVDLDTVDFSSSADGSVQLTFEIALDYLAQPLVFQTVVNGEADGRLAGLPLEPRAARRLVRIQLEDARPAEEIERLQLRNAGALGESREVSVRLHHPHLLDAAGQISEDWKVSVAYGAKKGVFSTDELIVFPPLGPRGARNISLRIEPNRPLTSRIPPADLELRYRLDHLVHARDAGADHFATADAGAIVSTNRVVPLRIEPVVQTTYVSIDLGTSANVAAMAYGREDAFAFRFLDLQKQLKKLREAAGEDYNEQLQQESGTPFLGSHLILRTDKRVDVGNLKESAISVSATKRDIMRNINAWIPNVKMMFGRGGIERFKTAFGPDFIYSDKGGRKSTPSAGPGVIDQTLNGLVSMLLEGFVRPQPELTRKADNQLEVVFTVPNNFTEGYREQISEWASRVRDEDHPGLNVSFVSESDAVAYSYLDFWDSLNEGKIKTKEELILAYDIGAGTLDMSLILRRYNPLDKSKHEVLVLGRVGLPKAGNYLDYVLANVMWDFYGPTSKRPVLNNFDPFSGDLDVLEKLEFHDWVRNELKPEISRVTKEQEGTNAIYKLPDNDRIFRTDINRREIDLVNLITEPPFEQYLDSVTKQALDRLMYNAFGNSNPRAIDTLLLSGRTVQMRCLRTALSDAVNSLPNQKNHPISEIYADQWKLKGLKKDASKLKGLVALGGLRYLRNYREPVREEEIAHGAQKINAAYGLFFNDSNSSEPEYRYVELMHPRRKIEYNKTYATPLLLTYGTKLYLVQTYERDEVEIARTYKDGTFTGDFTVNLLDRRAIHLNEKGLSPKDVAKIELQLDEDFGLVVQVVTKDGRRPIREEVRNFRRGYNPESPEATQSLWPYMGNTKTKDDA